MATWRIGDEVDASRGLGMSSLQGDEPSVDAYQMGLHRDGKKWNLPEDVIEERRSVLHAVWLA
jgi:hypothetical protein